MSQCSSRILFEEKRIYEDESSENGVQNPKVILETVMEMLESVQSKMDAKGMRISDIWTCGQMHGIVMWNRESAARCSTSCFDCLAHSPLFNWTYSPPDIRQFIETLPKWSCGELHPGFGLVSLAFLNKTDPESLKQYDQCGTIMDLFLTLLAHNSEPLISHHNAHSWGYCNRNGTWQNERTTSVLPAWIALPTISKSCTEQVGTWRGAKCHVATGDLQASVASLELTDDTAYVILGTSAQLCCLVNSNDASTASIPPTVVQLPYNESKSLLAACSMNGGNALETILKMHSPDAYTSSRLHNSLKELDECAPNMTPGLKVEPIFIAERGVSKHFSIVNCDSATTDLQILEATHQGIIANLFSLCPVQLLTSLKIKHLALIGSAQCPRFKRHIDNLVGDIFHFIIPTSLISTPLGATRF